MSHASALYEGAVIHRRTRPRTHRLRYRVFWLLLDLAELDALDRRLIVFSRNRFNLLSFHDRDHGDGSTAPLRDQVEARLQAVGVHLRGGPIRLLTMPRVLGYGFNPISIYYCHRPDGALAALVYEVTSTFGLRHAYVAPVSPSDGPTDEFRQRAVKRLYVSPFMGMDMTYRFKGRAPDDRLAMVIDGRDADGVLITAAMAGTRRPLTDARLLAASFAFPLLTLKVIAAIHWEALKLWLKGVPLTAQPLPHGEVQRRAGRREQPQV
jgi:DUF1365 family protein